MHIPDGWIDLPTSAAAALVAGGAVAVAARRSAVAVKERVTTLPAVVAAYLLVAQLLVVPVGFGTSAHVVGTGLATVLVGPALAIVCVAVVVVVQALLLADGGVTAIGLNVVNDGIVPALVAAAVLAVPAGHVRRGRRAPAWAAIAAGLSAFAAAGAATVEFAIGGTDAVSTRAVAASLGGAHVVVAALEGVLTGLVVASVRRVRPDFLALVPR